VNDKEIKQLISDTVNTTVAKLQAAGLLRDNSKTAYEKTEALLWQYPTLKEATTPYARRVVARIEWLLAEAKNEPYADVIRLYYFDGLKNAACAQVLACGERTARRYRVALVQQFSVRLASDEFIRELLQ
jgi:hypothetical protein